MKMGLGIWFARKGNVGGTARAVAKAWKAIKQENPDKNNEEIAQIYLTIRYGKTDKGDRARLVRKNLDRRHPSNPLNLSWTIFTVENNDEAMTVLDHSLEWKQIMREEIEKLGIKAD
jgi:hypothetical protein